MLKIHFEQTPIGRIGIAEENGSISHLCFENDSSLDGAEQGETPLIREAFVQLRAYLAGTRKEFSLPLAPTGSPFMLRLWQELCKVPYGATISYRDLAAAAGSPRGARAAGMACNRNPIAIFIPCHRVIGSSGSLTGFGGGLGLKERLLALEKSGRQTPNGKV